MTIKVPDTDTHAEDKQPPSDVSPACQDDIDESCLKDLVAEGILLQLIEKRIAKRKAEGK